MLRAIVISWIPSLIALAMSFGFLILLIRFSKARFDLSRIRQIHSCQRGGVQSLAFVITFPLFLAILLLIVQISQLMIALVVVNYAAYASARSASVWGPAFIDDSYARLGEDDDGQNEFPPGIGPDDSVVLDMSSVESIDSYKYDRIWRAAVLACVPISPSRDALNGQGAGVLGGTDIDEGLERFYPAFDQSSQTNPRIATRLDNKAAYSMLATSVRLTFEDRNSEPREGTLTYNPIGHPIVDYHAPEVGWQDPITVTVTHHFALLPGPGRLLDRLLVRQDGAPDRVSEAIDDAGSGLYTTPLTASATMTAEGLMSVRPYIHDP
jgi:hypothetical protein